MTYLRIVLSHCAATHYKLGVAYVRLGEWQLARREHRILKKLKPQLAERLHALIPKEG